VLQFFFSRTPTAHLEEKGTKEKEEKKDAADGVLTIACGLLRSKAKEEGKESSRSMIGGESETKGEGRARVVANRTSSRCLGGKEGKRTQKEKKKKEVRISLSGVAS